MLTFSNIAKMLLGCLCFATTACTKTTIKNDGNIIPEQPAEQITQNKLYPISFKIADVETFYVKTDGKDIPVNDYLYYLYYAAYDSVGRRVSKIEQDSTMNNSTGYKFGVFNDSLPKGTYTIIITGTTRKPSMDESDSSLADLYFRTYSDDVYFKKVLITVGDSANFSSSVKLERISGQLQLRLTDTLSPEVKTVEMITNNVPSAFYAATGEVTEFISTGPGGYYNLDTDPVVKLDFNLLGSNNKIQVVIIAYDKDGMKLYQKLIKDVVVKSNQKVILVGALTSTESTSGGIPMTFDPDYAGEPIIKNF